MGTNVNKSPRFGQVIPFIQDGEYYFKRGIKAYHNRDMEKAKKHFERAMQFDPEEPVYLCQLAAVLAEIGQYQESTELLKTAVEQLDPDMIECYYFLANNYAHQGLFKEASRYAHKYLEFAPDGEFTEDIEDLLDLISIETGEQAHLIEDEDELIMSQEKARQLLENGELEEASQLFEKMIVDYPEYWPAHNNLALAYFYKGEVNKAIKVLNDVLDANPGNLHALCNMAVFHHYLGKAQVSSNILEQLKAVQPINMEHRYKLGAAFALTGYYDEAYNRLKWLHKYGFEGDVAFYYWLAVSSYHTGRIEYADSVWKHVVELDPEKRNQQPWLKSSGNEPVFHDSQMYTGEDQIISDHLKPSQLVYALYMLQKDQDVEALTLIQRQIEGFPSYVEEFATHMLSKLTEKNNEIPSPLLLKSVAIADALYEGVSKKDREDTLQLWFEMFDRLILEEHSLKNEMAWVAATVYLHSKQKSESVTQVHLAERYNLSASTIRKYIQLAQNLVSGT